jgi:hypothetical protein
MEEKNVNWTGSIKSVQKVEDKKKMKKQIKTDEVKEQNGDRK